MKSALSKLPQEELIRLDIDLNGEFIPGTLNSEKLINAWNERQKEVKSAVEGLMKPAEFMKDIIKNIQNTTDQEIILKNLVVLESLLADIDNARDFHTIGGWKILLNFLQLNNSIEIRTQTALCIGTAVKNDYDYQLWILEDVNIIQTTQTSGLLLLLHNLKITLSNIPQLTITSLSALDLQKNYKLISRLIYAISSCTRGNMDIQETLVKIGKKDSNYHLPTILAQLTYTILEINPSNTLDSLNILNLQTQVSYDKLSILRKVWNLISDLLDELIYLREGLISEIILENQQIKGVEINDNLESKIKQATINIYPIGEEFLPTTTTTTTTNEKIDWISLTTLLINEFSKGCLLNDDSQLITSSSTPTNNPVLSPAPTTADIKSNIIPIYNESCLIFTSPTHRDIYSSVVNSFRSIKRLDKNSQYTENEHQISRKIEMIKSHPSMIDE